MVVQFSDDRGGIRHNMERRLRRLRDETLRKVQPGYHSSEGKLQIAQFGRELCDNDADNVGVTSVAWSNDRGGSGTCTGTSSWTSAKIKLQPGANVITVTASDASGNKTAKTLTVTYTGL
jgi:hypothetical protein